jgi:CRISPR-associated protein Cas1
MHLFINTYGTYVHIKDEIFEIRIPLPDSNEYKKLYFAPQKITGIVVTYSAAISTDAIILALKYNIDIVILDKYGTPLGRFWHSKLGSTTLIRRKQLELTTNNLGAHYIKLWINRKISNRISLLKKLAKSRPAKRQYIYDQAQKIENQIKNLKKLPDTKISEIEGSIRGIEGTAGRIYFETLSKLLSKEYQFNGRSMRPAKDLFNAFLNYAYGILYGRVEKSLIIAGLDPFVGILHRDDYTLKSMVLDFIEPYRIYAEESIFKLFSAKRVNKSHTDKLENGLMLNKSGKELILGNFIKFIDEDKVTYKNKKRTRSNIIQLEAHNFAAEILGNKQSNIQIQEI